MFDDYEVTWSSSSARLRLIKVQYPRIAYVERLAAEGKSNRKKVDGLLSRLEDIKAVLDERIVVLSGKSIKRV